MGGTGRAPGRATRRASRQVGGRWRGGGAHARRLRHSDAPPPVTLQANAPFRCCLLTVGGLREARTSRDQAAVDARLVRAGAVRPSRGAERMAGRVLTLAGVLAHSTPRVSR